MFLWVLFGELIVAHLTKKLSSFYGFQRINVVYTKSREADINRKKICLSYSFQASLTLCQITETSLHVTDTRVNLTLDKDYKRVIPRQIEYVQTVPKNKNECKEYRVEIQVSSIGVLGFPLHLLLCSKHFSHTGNAPAPWYRIFLQEVIVTQRARKPLAFAKSESHRHVYKGLLWILSESIWVQWKF
jgi:hypothetical protein